LNPIEAQALTKQFGKLTAVNNLDLRIAQGEFFDFIGPQRRRQDHNPANTQRPAPAHLRHGPGAGHRCHRRSHCSLGGGTVFLSKHILELVEKLCNRVGIIDQGKMMVVGWSPNHSNSDWKSKASMLFSCSHLLLISSPSKIHQFC